MFWCTPKQNRVVDLVQRGWFVAGVEVAATGEQSVQLKTPGVFHDIGGFICQLEDLDPSIAVDVTSTAGGQIEMQVTWKSSGSGEAAAPVAGSALPMIIAAVGAIIAAAAAGGVVATISRNATAGLF